MRQDLDHDPEIEAYNSGPQFNDIIGNSWEAKDAQRHYDTVLSGRVDAIRLRPVKKCEFCGLMPMEGEHHAESSFPNTDYYCIVHNGRSTWPACFDLSEMD